MLIAQITDMHILAAGKLFHSPRRAFPADAEPGWSHIDSTSPFYPQSNGKIERWHR